MRQAEPFERGKVVISLDTELGWGRINTGTYDVSRLPDRLDDGKAAITELLTTFDDYDVPVTWAIVGQLFRDLDEPPENPDIPTLEAVPKAYHDRDWWRMPDVIRRIRDSPVEHEIASHSATHADFSSIESTHAALDREIDGQWRDSLAEPPASSFVFPRNNIGHLRSLSDAGVSCFRGTPPRLSSGPSPTAFLPRKRGDLVNVPTSIAHRPYAGRGVILRNLPPSLKVSGLKLGVKVAARTGRVCHVTLHPKDFGGPGRERFFDQFRTWIEYVCSYRERGLVDVKTMETVADAAVFAK